MALLKRTVSARTIAANRRNAQKSTGPRTPEGKRRVAKNALKHGFRGLGDLIDEALLAPDLASEYAKYHQFLAELEHAWQPTNRMQSLLIGDLADLYWKRARAIEYQRAIHFRDGMIASLQPGRKLRREAGQSGVATTGPSSAAPTPPQGEHPTLKPLTPQWRMMVRQDAVLDRQIFDKVSLLLRLKAREDAELTQRANEMLAERHPMGALSELFGFANKADKSSRFNKGNKTEPITSIELTNAASKNKAHK